MGTWVDLEHIRARYSKPIPESQDPWLTQLIEDAEDELIRQIDSLPERIGTGEVPPVRVQRIVAAAILRVLRNPDGYSQWSRTTGPFTESVSRPSQGSSGEILYTEAELAALRPVADMAPVRSASLHLPAWRVP
jgi:hypothetical protein